LRGTFGNPFRANVRQQCPRVFFTVPDAAVKQRPVANAALISFFIL